MSDNDLVSRYFYCMNNNLCFISKLPLKDNAVAVYHSKIIGYINVLDNYAIF